MPRVRTRPINEFIQKWMTDEGVETLKELAIKTRLPYSTILRWADMDGDHKPIEALIAGARARRMTIDEFIMGLIAS